MNYKDLEKLRKTHNEVIKLEKLDEYTAWDTLKNTMKMLEDSVPSNAEHVSFEFDTERSYGYYDSLDIELHLKVTYWIAKTPEELKAERDLKRRASEAAKQAAITRKANQEKKDREEYERLKAKFEV